MKTLLTFIGFLLFRIAASSQVSENYFSDMESKPGGSIYSHVLFHNMMIVAGSGYEHTITYPSISCLDTTGTVIWRFRPSNYQTYGAGSIISNLMMGADSNLYALCFNGTGLEIWKLNPDTGSIIWINTISSSLSNTQRYIKDLDAAKLVVTYSDSYNGITYQIKIASIDKSTGNILSNDTLSYLPWTSVGYGFEVDTQKNVYYTVRDTMYKVNGINHNIIWKKQYSGINVTIHHNIYYDLATNCVFFFSQDNGNFLSPHIVKVDASTGNLISNYATLPNKDLRYYDMKVVGRIIYVTWRHIYVGASASQFNITKYDMDAGTGVWSTSQSLIGLGNPNTPNSGNSQGCLSLDVDDQGDVYMTGYYGDANYGPENWGVIKVNGTNGSKMYEQTITNDSIQYNDLSEGTVASVINGKPYFAGVLQTGFNPQGPEATLAIVKLEPAAGQTIFKKYLGGTYQFPSSTLSIQNYLSSQTLVMKQEGRSVVIEMYDIYHALKWKRHFTAPYLLLGYQLSFIENGDIIFTSQAMKESAVSPYYSGDTIYVTQMNSNGNTSHIYSIDAGGYYSTPVELICDTSSILLLYNRAGMIYYNEIYGGTVSVEHSSFIHYTDVHAPTKYSFNKSQTQTLFWGYQYGACHLISLNKVTQYPTDMGIVSSDIAHVNQVIEIDTSIVILCGSDSMNRAAVSLYNTTTVDTIWTKQLSVYTNSKTINCVLDAHRTYMYTISSDQSNIVVHKIAVNNGNVQWSYSYNGAANRMDYPVSLAYDSFRQQVIVTGFELDPYFDTTVVILTLSTSGLALDTIHKVADTIWSYAYSDIARCSDVLADGSQWVGGNLDRRQDGKAGFMYEIASVGPCAPINQTICLVDIDTGGALPAVIWEKANKAATDSFYIYRTNTPDSTYTHISSVCRDSLSIWKDMTAQSSAMSYRYKISAKDTCGNIGTISPYHQTLFLASRGAGSFNVTPYTVDGVAISGTYALYRDADSTGNWQLLTSMAPNQTTVSDPNYSSHPNARYRVVITLPNPCNPTRGVVTISSNIIDRTHTATKNIIDDQSVEIYPNPAFNLLTIHSPSYNQQSSDFVIYTANGQKTDPVILDHNSSEIILNTAGLAPGQYVLVINNSDKSVTKRFEIVK